MGADDPQNAHATSVLNEALNCHEAILSSAVRLGQPGAWQYDCAKDRLTWSDSTLEIFGIKREQFGGRMQDFLALVVPEDRAKLHQVSGCCEGASPKVVQCEYRIQRPDGEIRTLLDRGTTTFDSQGMATGRAGTVVDVTDEKSKEEQLASSEERYRVLFEKNPHPMWVISWDSMRFLAVNDAAIAAYGYSREEFLKMTVADIRPPEDVAALKEALNSGHRGMCHFGIWRHRIKSGDIRYVNVSAYSLQFQGQPASLVLALDVTESHQAATSLGESEQRFRQIAENIQEVFWILDPMKNKLLYVSPAYERIWGESAKTAYLSSRYWFRAINAGDRARVEAHINKAKSSESAELFRINRPDGDIRWIRSRAYPVKNAQGQVYRIIGTAEDVTEARLAEEALRESEERLRLALEAAGMATFDWDVQNNSIVWSPRHEALWGYAPGEFDGSFEGFARRIHPDDLIHVTSGLSQCMANREPFAREFRVVWPDGSIHWVQSRGEFFVDDVGHPLHMRGVVLEITTVKQAQEALRISDERFRLLVKATNDAIWDWDIKTNVLWWSEGFELLFGFKRTEMESRLESWTSRVHPDDRERVVKGLEALIEGDEQCAWTNEYRFARSDGSFAWVLDRGYLIRGAEGAAIRMIGGMTDISERKLSEEKLREQAALLDIAHDAIMVKNLEGEILYWNKAAEKIYQWTAGEVLGRKSWALFNLSEPEFNKALATVLQMGDWRGEVRNKSKSGAELTVEARWSLVRDAKGGPKSILCIYSDITEKKKIEARAFRNQRIDSIGTLAGGIAHDLNNVLAPILMSSQMLLDTCKNPDERSMVEVIHSSAERAADLVRQVLSFARGVDGKQVPLNPSMLLREIKKIIGDTFPKNIVFRVHTEPDLWAVRGDPTQLHQVLMNLCVNARDAMPDGGKLIINLANLVIDEIFAAQYPGSRPGNYVSIFVSDTGTGMTPEVREKLFEPFFTTKPQGKGTGLGLPTSLSIVKNHGGFMDIVSKQGQGSTFKVYLPADLSALNVSRPAPEHSGHPHGNGELVLVVDDEENVRLVTKKILERFGYRVVLAQNGAEAVSIYAQKRAAIAVVLLDMVMPIMDGPTTVVALKSINPNIKVIASSGYTPKNLTSQMTQELTCFIPKPYAAETLLNTLQEILAVQNNNAART